MKKMISLMLVMMSLSALLWASGGQEAPSAADAAEPVTLSWYFMGSYPQSDQASVYKEFNSILKEKTGTVIDFKPIGWGDYDQKMQVIIASGESYDLCYTANWINNYHQNVAKGAFLPLDDLLTEHAPQLKASVPSKIWDAARVKGKIYGMINYQISTMTSTMAFPRELTDRYGLDVDALDRLEELEPYLQAVKDGEGLVPLGIGNDPGTILGYVNSYLGFEEIGGRAVPGVIMNNDPELKVINQFETEEFRNWIYLMRDWYNKGFIAEDAIAITDINPNLSSGNYGVSFIGNYAPDAEAQKSAQWGYDVEVAAISDSMLVTSGIIATMQAVSAASKHPERAVEFMEILNSDKELYNLLCYGIEGTHFNRTGGEYIELIPETGYTPNTNWAFASSFNAYLLPGMPADVWEQTKALNSSAVASPLIGFSFDPSKVQSEISQCTSVREQYLPALELGALDPEVVLPEFLAKLETAGARTIIDEMQRQIDAWKMTR